MSKSRLQNRRCPECGEKVRWASKNRGPSHTVKCIDRVSCKWRGPYYDTMPLRRKRVDPSQMDQLLKAMHRSLDLMVSGTRAISKFEDFTLQHPHADPDPRGNQAMSSYLAKVALLQFLQEVLAMSSIEDEDLKKLILENEACSMFPRPPNIVLGKGGR